MNKTLFIVGAGFSHNAGLPLASNFSEELLDTDGVTDKQSLALIGLLKLFVSDVFAGGRQLEAEEWPSLEDIFTSIDLAANTGHNLGKKYAASELRTIRRALIVRMSRMLWRKLRDGREGRSRERRTLSQFFARVNVADTAFLSMNWDTVVEHELGKQGTSAFDYGFDAVPATFTNSTVRLREVAHNARVAHVLKPHGSINWMYCDCCGKLFWFTPRFSDAIASRLFKESDSDLVERLTGERPPKPVRPGICPACSAQSLGTRFATFSYRKALDFSMHLATWHRAEEVLQEAENWVFVGYSMPPADYQFKHLLKRVQLSRRARPNIVLVTKASPGDHTIDNYRRFFGRVAIPSSHIHRDGLTAQVVNALLDIGALVESPSA